MSDHGNRVAELEAEVQGLRAALVPFARFAADNVDENGWKSGIHREPISYWFGPSDFRMAQFGGREPSEWVGKTVDNPLVELLAIKLYEHDELNGTTNLRSLAQGGSASGWFGLADTDRELYRKMASGLEPLSATGEQG